MHTKYVILLRYKYFNPMKYTVYLIKKKELVYPVPAWLVKSSDEMKYESNAKLIRLYVKIKNHLFKMLDK